MILEVLSLTYHITITIRIFTWTLAPSPGMISMRGRGAVGSNTFSESRQVSHDFRLDEASFHRFVGQGALDSLGEGSRFRQPLVCAVKRKQGVQRPEQESRVLRLTGTARRGLRVGDSVSRAAERMEGLRARNQSERFVLWPAVRPAPANRSLCLVLGSLRVSAAQREFRTRL
jgi:hypothetical protein